MGLSHDAVLLLAFGGPTSPDDIRPFLDRVLRGHPVPPARIEEVVRHYKAVGGRSPLNDITVRQARAVEKILKQLGLPLPVYVGMHYSHPFIRETLNQMTANGVKRALGFILSSHQTEASWQRYQQNAADARLELGGDALEIDYCPGWHSHPLFIQAWTEQIEEEMEKVVPARRSTIPLVFTAHSIPEAMAARSPYCKQLQESCSLVAGRVNHKRWLIAYQSRSGKPTDPWLGPDVGNVIRDLAAQGFTEVIVAPIGFVCDHVEILYDLDIEARKIAEDCGVRFLRASCPNDHPTFIAMMADVVQSTFSGKPPIVQ